MNKYRKIAIDKFHKVVTDKENEIIFQCPKCNRPKLYVNTINGLYHCFRCNYKGKLHNKASLSDLRNKYNITETQYKDTELNLIYFQIKPLTEEQKQALYNRGITDSDIKYYNICGRSIDNRIQIPNFVKGCFTDVVCTWQYDKTKVNEKNPKYLNSEGTKKSNTLFNIYNLDKGINQIILTEGIFNAITAGRNAVASYGCHISDRQCELILEKQPKSILIAYDSDEPGVKGSLEVIQKLKNLKYSGLVEYILLPKGVDINDIGHDNFINYVSSHKVIVDLNNPVSVILPELLFRS